MWGDLFVKIGSSLLGSLATGIVTSGLNYLFSPSAPSQHDVARDIRSQAEAQRASQPVRTPEQEQSDRLAVEATKARQSTFAQLSNEYNQVKAAGPTWDPYEEARIREEAMGEASMRGMSESGQAQQHVARRLDEARLKRSQLHQTALSDLRTQMAPYAGVIPPGQPATASPVSQFQKEQQNPLFKSAPIGLSGILMPDEEKVKKVPPQSALGLRPNQSDEWV